MTQDQPSSRVVEQRIRNRVIEHLDVVASYSEQDEYARVAPVYIPYELINQWEDWVLADPRTDSSVLKVYSEAEREALGAVQHAWKAAADALPNDYPSLESAQAMPEWAAWRDAAASALKVFSARGRMSEEEEQN